MRRGDIWKKKGMGIWVVVWELWGNRAKKCKL